MLNKSPLLNKRVLQQRFEAIFAFLALCAVFAYVYPELFFLRQSPMGANPLTLKDPTVSWSAFMPAFRDFKYELLEHGNLLWSNARGLGQPILGNTVQGGPLFPLNLVLLPLADSLYWSVMPIMRIILIGLGCFLIARRIIGLSITASLFFALLVCFNINTVRWMNHPWVNGFLAGIWYFYFACRTCLSQTKAEHIIAVIGFSTSVFAMVTTGFPEAAAMSALLFGILFIGFLFANWSLIKPKLLSIATRLLACHVIGFGFSAIQIFALIEFIDVSAAIELRSGFAGGSYESKDLYPYFLAQVSPFGTNKAHQTLLTFSMGLWGLFFAIRGILNLISGNLYRSNALRVTAFTVACSISMSIFIAKAFGLSELVKQIFLVTPVLAESHFPLYFSPLFFVCFGLLAAFGFHDFIHSERKTTLDKFISLTSSILAIVLVVSAGALSLVHFYNIPVTHAADAIFNKPQLAALKTFIIASVPLLLLQLAYYFLGLQQKLNKQLATTVVACALLLLTAHEIDKSVKKVFFNKNFITLGASKDTSKTIKDAIAKAPLPPHELRGANPNGDFILEGLATIDNGVSAILPPESRRLRLALFSAPYGGYVQLQKPLRPWSYHAFSSNMVYVHATPRSVQNWEGYKVDEQISSTLTRWPSEPQVLNNPLFIQGRSSAQIDSPGAISVWLHFQENLEDEGFWIEANKASQTDRGLNEKGLRNIDTKWRVRMPAEWLEHDSYKVTLRQINPRTATYHDAAPVQLTIDREHPSAILAKSLRLLASNEKETRHLYFDENALPRAYIASACKYTNTAEEQFEFYRSSDAITKGVVIFPHNPTTQANVDCESYHSKFKRVAILDDHRTEMKFETIQGPALLQLNDSFYPGWSAYEVTSNGKRKPLKLQRANTNGRSVYLAEARNYTVEMDYKPFWLNWVYALFVFATVLLGWIILMILRGKMGKA